MKAIPEKIIHKREFVRLVATAANFTITDTTILWEAVEEVFKTAIENKIELVIEGFGNLHYMELPEMMRTNPNTLEKIYCPATQYLAFKLSESLKNIRRDIHRRKYRTGQKRQEAITEFVEKEKQKEIYFPDCGDSGQ